MTNPLRVSVGSMALVVLAACSSQPAQPAISDDLKQDLARAGGGVQLAGATAPRLEVVTAMERTERSVVTPRSPAVSRAASARAGSRAVLRSARRVAPAPAQPRVQAEEVAPEEEPRFEPAPDPAPSQRRPQSAPMPSTQREPAGGWSTPGRIIRNAPFPINPVRGNRSE